MPRLAPVEPCPRCLELALVSGACRCCGHLEPEALERCDEAPPAGLMPGGAVSVRRRWIVERGLLGALAAGPLAAGALALLVLLRRELPPAALAGLALGFAVLAWTFAAMLANATTIEVRDRSLAVHHGPLPIPGVRDLIVPAPQIEKLGMRRDPGTGDLTVSFALELHCGGRVRDLYRSADRLEVARLLRFLRGALTSQRRSVR
jgi:hypothetical protein